MTLGDLPALALFRYVPGPSPESGQPLSDILLAVEPDDHCPTSLPNGAEFWSRKRTSIYGQCAVKDVDLTHADRLDPKYASCALALATVKWVGVISKDEAIEYRKDPTVPTAVIAAAKTATCQNTQCPKHEMTVEAGPSGQCYCCGIGLRFSR